MKYLSLSKFQRTRQTSNLEWLVYGTDLPNYIGETQLHSGTIEQMYKNLDWLQSTEEGSCHISKMCIAFVYVPEEILSDGWLNIKYFATNRATSGEIQ